MRFRSSGFHAGPPHSRADGETLFSDLEKDEASQVPRVRSGNVECLCSRFVGGGGFVVFMGNAFRTRPPGNVVFHSRTGFLTETHSAPCGNRQEPTVKNPSRLALASLSFAGAVVAQENAVTNRLPSIVVTATRVSDSVDATAASVTSVDSSEFNAGKFNSVAQALELVPGVTYVSSGTPGQTASVFVRGTEANHTLLLIDGRRIPPSLAGGFVYENLSLDGVDSIEVVRTPSSVLYGADAIGGVINLRTLSGRGLSKPVSELSFEGGSFHTFREAASTRGAVGKFDYALSASRFDADYPRDNSEFEMTSLRGSVGYEATKDLYFDLKGNLSISDAGSPGSVSFPDPIATLKREVSRISPGVEWKINETLSTKAYYSFDRQWQRYRDQFASDNKLTVDAHQVDAQAEWQPVETLRIVPGVTMVDLSFCQFNAAGVENIRAHQTGVGGFIQGLWNPVERLNFVSAIRYDGYTDYDDAFTWRQAAAYRVARSETRLHASVSQSYSPPTAQDLYFPGFSNPNLLPEESLGYEVGVEQPFFNNHVRVSATWFRNEIDNLIQFVFPSPQNVSKALTEGVELGLEYQPNERFKMRAAYTYLTAIDDNTGLRLLRRPRHQVGVNSTYTPIEKLTLSAGVSWVVERQDSQFPGQVPIGDYLTLRGAVSYRFNEHVEIWARGENLTDDRYDYIRGFPALGFGAFGGIKLTF